MYNRLILFNLPPKESFFLWGGRQTGKSTLLKSSFFGAKYIDLLMSDIFAKYAMRPSLLREELGILPPGSVIVIDEIQKIPILLDEIHWLIENRKLVFAMSGSSARKLRRGHANLLGGRAIRRELFGFVAKELGGDFDLIRMLNQGYLPPHYLSEPQLWKRKIMSYLGDYLKEEVAAEGLVRNLTGFSDFLQAASLSDTEVVSFTSFSRDVGVSANTVREYFSILEDTLVGSFLPAFTSRPKRRVVAASKFYFHDVGVVNQLARRGTIEFASELCGKAFENWVAHELRAYNEYSEKLEPLTYWRLASGVEVDFIVGDLQVAIEAKSSRQIGANELRNLRVLTEEHPEVAKRIIVTCSGARRRTDDGIDVMPALDFVEALWSGEIF